MRINQKALTYSVESFIISLDILIKTLDFLDLAKQSGNSVQKLNNYFTMQ